MRIVDCGEQGSPEWLATRRGRITASRMKDVLNYLKKGGESQKRIDYRIEIVAERLTGLCPDNFVSKEMQWGIDNEPAARTAYELANNLFVEQVGFVLHPTLDCSGSSPDSISGKGGQEYKCPKSTTHIEWMLAGVIPEEHLPQCHWVMACCELDWIDWSSFDPRMPEELQLFTVRLPRDENIISEMEKEVAVFECQIKQEIAKIHGIMGVSGVTSTGQASSL